MIDKNILIQFFQGKTSIEQEKAIRKWLDADEKNHQLFMNERLAYDALLMHRTAPESSKSQTLVYRIVSYVAAAAVVLLIIVSVLYFDKVFDVRNTTAQYNTIIVPAGQRMNLILSDNSTVWLNANTTLRYPTQFDETQRTVYLDGEAYFDISENKACPFIVKTAQGDIKVTGTKFNVEAYSVHKSFETSLFEGGVELYRNNHKILTLQPHEKSTYCENRFTISKIDNTEPYLWREGLIAFNDKKLEDILFSLEKYFDIQIKIKTENIPSHTYTGKFRQSDGIDYALRVLQKSIRFNYERDDNEQIIYIK